MIGWRELYTCICESVLVCWAGGGYWVPCSISLSILLKQVLSLNVEMIGDQAPESLFLPPTMLWSQLFRPQPSVYMFAEDLNSCLRACITSNFICCSISQAPTEILVITLLETDVGWDACSLFQWRCHGVRTGSFGGRRGIVILQTVVHGQMPQDFITK